MLGIVVYSLFCKVGKPSHTKCPYVEHTSTRLVPVMPQVCRRDPYTHLEPQVVHHCEF